MKRVVIRGLAVALFAFIGIVFAGAQSKEAQAQAGLPQAQDQSLGDYARALKKSKSQNAKPAATVYDNDNLPAPASINVVGGDSAPAEAAANGAKPDANAAQQPTQDDPSKVKPGQSLQDRQKAYDAWKEKINAQKERVDQLAHDLDEAKNHPKATSTVAVWPYNQDYQKDVEEKQKALDQARSDLDKMQDDAHKEGVPSSIAQ